VLITSQRYHVTQRLVGTYSWKQDQNYKTTTNTKAKDRSCYNKTSVSDPKTANQRCEDVLKAFSNHFAELM